MIATREAEGEPGFEQACWVVCNRAFFAGDWNEYRRVAELAERSLGEAARR